MHRCRLLYSKEEYMKYISHLDLRRAIVRALRRARIRLKYSEGFNPHPRLVFAAPLAVGWEGEKEYVDLYLMQEKKKKDLMSALNNQLPSGLEIKDAWKVAMEQPPLSSVIEAAFFEVYFSTALRDLEDSVEKLLSEDNALVIRRGKKGEKKVNIRPFLYRIWKGRENDSLFMLLATGSQGGTRPEEVVYCLGNHGNIAPNSIEIIRRKNVFMRQEGKFVAPDGVLYEKLEESILKGNHGNE